MSKSDLLLGVAATSHLRSIIFRREQKQGASLIERSQEVLGACGARFNGTQNVWRGIPAPGFPRGRMIRFAGVKDAKDVYKYRGNPHDAVLFDEADSFLEAQIRFLLGWLRTTIHGQRCRTILCFNPPVTAKGRWLLDFFGPWINRKDPHYPVPGGEIRYFGRSAKDNKDIYRDKDPSPFTYKGQVIYPKSRSFLPARVEDNPYLMATDYVKELENLPEPLRSQLRYGDMSAGLEDDPWQTIPSDWVEAAMKRGRDNPVAPHGRLSALGVDVARGGADAAVLAKRIRNWYFPLEKFPGMTIEDGPAVVALIVKTLELHRVPGNWEAAIKLDVLNAGWSVYDGCRAADLEVYGVNFGEGTDELDFTEHFGFVNVRSLAWWRMRESLDPTSGVELCLPDDAELFADLTAPRYKMQSGKIAIEKKEDIAKRIGRSTDCGDAVCLCNLETTIDAGVPIIFRR